ncbi:MAG: DUF3316 domain-containing protein [Microbacter sp.]
MRRIFTFGVLFFSLMFATSSAQDAPNATTTSSWTVGYGHINLLDQYLSPLVYSGSIFRGDYQSMHYLSLETTRVSIQWSMKTSFGMEHNPAATNSIFYFSLQPGVGVHYHFRPTPHFKLLIGGIVDLFFANKYSFANGNNPYSADLSTRLNASVIAQYNCHLGKMPLILRYSLTSPVIGGMFVPQYGESYYEIFTLKHLAHTILFTSYANYLALQNSISADFVLNRCTLRLSFYHDYDKHHGNSLYFETMQTAVSVGTVINFAVFDHAKRKMPKNYHDINR